MALVTSDTTIPDLAYEYHTITVDSIGQASANTFVAHLQNPLRNVVQARLLAAHVHANLQTEHLYLSIDELDTHFNDRAAIPGTSNVHTGQGNISVVRSSFGSIITESATHGNGNTLITFKDNYPVVAQYIDPIRRIDKLTVTLLDQNGNTIKNSSDAGANFFVIRFVCRRPNL
jgi:hypothetical protein